MSRSAQPESPSAESAGRISRPTMKWLSCIIRPERLDVVRDALNKLNLVGGVTVTDVRGFGQQRGSTNQYRGVPYGPRFIEKVRVDVVVPECDVARVTTLISQLAYTGNVGDGKIFSIGVQKSMRIRTGERGIDAL